MINAVDNLVGAPLIITAQCDDGKPAKTDILLQQFPLRTGIPAFKSQILFKGQRIYRDGYKPPGQVSGQFTGHQPGIGASYINIHVLSFQQAVDASLPVLNLLYLVEEQIAASFATDLFQQFPIHIRRGNIFRDIHFRISFLYNMILRNAPAAELLRQHLKNG